MIQPTATLANPTVHLDEPRLGPELASCPLCGEGGPRRRLFPIQRDPDVWLLGCRGCRGASASRMPTAEALEAYYAGYYDRDAGPTLGEAGVTIVGAARLARRILDDLVAPPSGPATVLDFGGGDGTIGLLVARGLLERGARRARVELVDRHPPRSPGGDERIELRLHEDLDALAPASCDVVVASGVLEHVPRPVDLLRELLRRMGPRATFYARTPWEVPLIRAARRLGLRPSMGYPGHLHDLGQRFWAGVPRLEGLATFHILRARPSIVATGFRSHPLRTLAAHLLKAPNAVLGARWGFVGGWEVIATRDEEPGR